MHKWLRLYFDNIINLNRLSFEELIWKKNSAQKSKAIGEILKAFRIEPIGIDCNTHKEFYDKLIANYLK